MYIILYNMNIIIEYVVYWVWFSPVPHIQGFIATGNKQLGLKQPAR